jgi:hypothetical protein
MDKDKLHRLYNIKKLSMVDIARKLKVTHAKIYYWFKKYKIERRSRRESSYVKQNPNGDPFKIKEKLNNKERELLISGLMLYCAEGHRTNRYSIQLANLDHRILKVFAKFLREICGVHQDKMDLYVQVYKEFNRNTARDYWSRVLRIPKPQIFVYPHTDKRSKIEGQRSKFGIARIQVHNSKLKSWIDRESDCYLDRF